ncbi:MAG: hypothetical protein E7517_07735 [Ruminococcaceae bacterium]|nr:hypothetical protein [Oscillospiraceae bacterium]
MPNRNNRGGAAGNGNCCERQFDRAISADITRIYDSCADRDCLENLEVVFPADDAPLIESACSVKATNADILTAYVDVDEVSYNRGCYAVEATYYFTVDVDVYQPGSGTPDSMQGVCTFTKRSMLYGASGQVNTFSSADTAPLPSSVTEPVAKVQAMNPMLLGCEIVNNRFPSCVQIPEAVNEAMGGDLAQNTGERKIVATLGLFSIMQLNRAAQVTLPSYEFAVPEKECNAGSDSPCDVFRSFDFPLEEFFPQSSGTCNNCGCDTPMDYEGECPNVPQGNRQR